MRLDRAVHVLARVEADGLADTPEFVVDIVEGPELEVVPALVEVMFDQFGVQELNHFVLLLLNNSSACCMKLNKLLLRKPV